MQHFLLERNFWLNPELFVHKKSIQALLHHPLWAERLATETTKHRFKLHFFTRAVDSK